MEKLKDHLVIPLYKMISDEESPCISSAVMGAVSELADWFA